MFQFHVHCFFTFAVSISTVGDLSSQQHKSYKCNNCDKVYRHQCSLWRHERYECGKPAMFQCPICSYRAKQKCNLIVHIYHVHRMKWSLQSVVSPYLRFKCLMSIWRNISDDLNLNFCLFSLHATFLARYESVSWNSIFEVNRY